LRSLGLKRGWWKGSYVARNKNTEEDGLEGALGSMILQKNKIEA
jgi:hypothetical protein